MLGISFSTRESSESKLCFDDGLLSIVSFLFSSTKRILGYLSEDNARYVRLRTLPNSDKKIVARPTSFSPQPVCFLEQCALLG